ncbi:DUF2750 domain-containing protein [Blastococcus sp. CT_GayMR20]|uniref:DUF2750 domain-containing protein n=1 Tax=Blastococcus sp. CT_GayMR20 TaxID=2559609 RepID=UPI0010730AE6|nr:DUF2750 domain-containing protein [Blastococcus sp. CT_GayMR20]TFV67138.1 DUF2750 domain-containing protein [Blastococcus sp. CT_GayMR20]
MQPDALMTYFLTQVTDEHAVHALLRADRWVTFLDEESGRSVFPVWSHPDFAKACAVEEWAGTTPDDVPLDDWLRFLSRLEADGSLVAVMPRPDGSHLLVEPSRHRGDLESFLDGP